MIDFVNSNLILVSFVSYLNVILVVLVNLVGCCYFMVLYAKEWPTPRPAHPPVAELSLFSLISFCCCNF